LPFLSLLTSIIREIALCLLYLSLCWKLRGDEITPEVLKKALEQTAEKRGSPEIMKRYGSIFSDVLASEQMRGFWIKYQSGFDYAKGISFEAVVGAAKEILSAL
jgi:hypothetical protein